MCNPNTVEEIPSKRFSKIRPRFAAIFLVKNKRRGYAEEAPKQTIDISTLSKNIINTSVDIVTENNSEIKQKTEVSINRVGNYRLLVVSSL